MGTPSTESQSPRNQLQVHIFLDEGITQSLFLAISTGDIERLSHSPHKRLEFVMFTICGAHGVLSATPAGIAVDDDTAFFGISQSYYYRFLQGTNGESLFFLSLQSSNISTGMSAKLNERETSTARTPRATDFRTRIVNRDQSCVVTTRDPRACDAAHLIPRSKGDAVGYLLPYLISVLIWVFSISKKVVQSCRGFYPSQEIEISDILRVRDKMLSWIIL